MGDLFAVENCIPTRHYDHGFRVRREWLQVTTSIRRANCSDDHPYHFEFDFCTRFKLITAWLSCRSCGTR